MTLIIQVSISLVTYFFIISVTPKTYLDKINRSTDFVLKETISQFSGITFEECKRKLLDIDTGREDELGKLKKVYIIYQIICLLLWMNWNVQIKIYEKKLRRKK